ncbi:uncharacterized protein LOC100833710 [Brachypodium distachyon]|uniref:Uncharacterized protein n=1 Tax=Brachypodium distachyon TaxID=15368 RepID=I1IEX8_BRADI|nr:uncharacterized protein LOC100833710 [Brachypodium distachyon]KQK01781.1 hypothetical protein BRADI_3g58180v3 [Brachypodium distachyon]|eukprot:XP_003573059.1 uncharacterized protein LOC100833710 [Brachypodium distachyon]
MEIATLPPPPPGAFSFDGAAYPTEPTTRNPFASAADDMAAAPSNPFLGPAALTAPPSPNPFGILLPASSTVDDGGDPFDLFQHFASAPASPSRAAAIYAHFSADNHDYEGFATPRTPKVTASSVPFDWEEKPGKPKPGFGSTPASNGVFEGGDEDDADFDFGVLLDGRSAQTPAAAADELFDEGKIRPLKPPPRLLADSGSVGSSPRSPMTARSAIWSPRLRRSTVRPEDGFDPFAAAMAKASSSSMAPSPLGPCALTVGTAAASLENSTESVTSPPFAPLPKSNGGRKKWRLSDLLLFRRLSAKGRAAGGSNISREPVFKYSPVQNLGTTPVKKTTTDGGDVSGAGKQQRKQSKYGEDGAGMQHGRQSFMVGCIRLNPGLHRLAKKGFNAGSSSHFGRRTARSAMAG